MLEPLQDIRWKLGSHGGAIKDEEKFQYRTSREDGQGLQGPVERGVEISEIGVHISSSDGVLILVDEKNPSYPSGRRSDRIVS